MKNQELKLRFTLVIALIALMGMSCSTVMVEQAPLPEVPEYVKVPHPVGFEIVDLKAMLLSPMAPKGVLGEFSDTCDEEFKKLTATTVSRDDIRRGAEELVTRDPERIHWCYYSKLARLQDVLQSDATWSARQKKVLDTYGFLSPVANAFVAVYQDSRYLRWASIYYGKISEWVFFRKVAPGPENTLMMVNTQRGDLEPWVPLKNSGQGLSGGSVFEKYGIDLTPTTQKIMNPVSEAPEVAESAPPDVSNEGGTPAAPSTETRAPASVESSATVAPSTVAPPAEMMPAEQVPTDQAPR